MNSLVWLRQDLRLRDNPALHAALQSRQPVILLYVYDTAAEPALGGASNWWLHHSLAALQAEIEKKSGKLILRRGAAAEIIIEFCTAHEISKIYLNRCYEPYAVQRDTALKTQFTKQNIEWHSYNSALLAEPWETQNKQGEPFKVFSPFWKHYVKNHLPPAPIPTPRSFQSPKPAIKTDRLKDWGLLPEQPDWAGGLREVWTPGEAGAQQRFRHFLQHGLRGYKSGRDQPAQEYVSRLSPHLHFGEISVRQIWHAAQAVLADDETTRTDVEKFLAEIGWREFAYALLYYNPDLPSQPLQSRFTKFPWRPHDKDLKAWQHGQTGYPIVDAGMRQLWQTGWQHNRVRMITASFLVKNLLQNWTAGAAWFWDTLCDADLANNSASWQWVAGSGADAAPYFRVFNPVLQGYKFDPDGEYVKTYLPELARLPVKYIHSPWDAPPDILKEAGVVLGKNYPKPIVELYGSRDRALLAFKQLKEHL